MSSRALRTASVARVVLVMALAACAQKLPPPVTIPAPTTASSEELRWVVEAALAAHNWTVSSREPGVIRAWVHSRGTAEQAVIEISYGSGAVQIRCLEEDVSKNRYDRWMNLLAGEIRKNTAQMGMGGGRPAAGAAAAEER